MKNKRFVLLATCASPLLLASGLPREKVSFAPGEGVSLTKTFSVEGKLELDEMEVLMNGEANPMMPSMEMSMTWDQAIKIADQYVKLGDGRPAELTRHFEDIAQEIDMEMSMEMMGQTNDQNAKGTGTSDLEGKTITFHWDEGSEEYAASFAEGTEGEEDLLEGLIEDMDLRMLLPADEVAEGDEWDIPTSALVDLFAPGGDLKWDVEMEGGDAMSMGGGDPETMSNLRDMFGESVKGTATARYAGTRSVDGTSGTFAVIELKIDIESANDLTEKIEEAMAESLPEGVDVSLESVDMEFTFAGGGELVWDLRGGHMKSLAIEGDVTIGMDMAMTMNVGEEMSMEMSMQMSGTISETVEIE